MRKNNTLYMLWLCSVIVVILYVSTWISNASDNISQEEFIKIHTPNNTSWVWVKTKDNSKNEKKEIKNYSRNLWSPKWYEEITFEKPDWMKYAQQETLCNKKTTKTTYFANNLQSQNINRDCIKDIIYSPELNIFSTTFFRDTLSWKNLKQIEEWSEDESIIWAIKNSNIILEINDRNTENIESQIWDIIQKDMLDQNSEVITQVQEITEEEVKNESTVVYIKWDKRVLELWNEFNSDVEDLLSTALWEKNIHIEKNEIIKKEDLELTLAVKETVEKEKGLQFPNVEINNDVNALIQAIFLSDVKNYLFATTITSEDYALSSSSLARAYNLLEQDLQVIVLWDYSVIWIHEWDYYNNAIRRLFLQFNTQSSNSDDLKKLASQLSNISFSLSSYANDALSPSIRNAFWKKLIVDIQTLASHYDQSLLREEKRKNNKIQLFLSQRAKALQEKEERKKQEEKEAEEKRIKKAEDERIADELKKAELQKRIEELKKQIAEAKLKKQQQIDEAMKKKAKEIEMQKLKELSEKSQESKKVEKSDSQLEDELQKKLESSESWKFTNKGTNHIIPDTNRDNTWASDSFFDAIMQ